MTEATLLPFELPAVRRKKLTVDFEGEISPPMGAGLRAATVENVQAALEAMRTKEDGSPVRPATVNTYVAAVKSFLGFAHRPGFTRFNAAPLIKPT
jgi:hypothetical protein